MFEIFVYKSKEKDLLEYRVSTSAGFHTDLFKIVDVWFQKVSK